jgi:hypothetical protein
MLTVVVKGVAPAEAFRDDSCDDGERLCLIVVQEADEGSTLPPDAPKELPTLVFQLT